MNTVWPKMAWNEMLFDQSWIFTGIGAAAAAVIVAVMALVVGRAVRSRPAPLRYGLLLAGLVVVGIVPAVAAANRLAGLAFVTVPPAVVIGPLKPVVVLPVGMVNTLERDKLAAVLTHEMAHVVRGDLWVGLLQHAVAAIFWWCLPVHRLNRRLAEVLVEMAARLRGDRARLSIAALGAMDEKPALEGRVERLVYRTARSVPMTRMNQMAMAAAGVFGVVALAVVLATTIHAADEPDIVEAAAAQAEPAQSYRQLIGPSFSDVSGSEANRSLCEKNLAKA